MRTHDYPAKNAVRALWMKFLADAHIDDVGNRTGLYLPAHENLELPGYRKLGFSPTRLYGAEYRLDQLAPVEQAAQGVNILPGSFQDAMNALCAEGASPLTFAYLDLEGSYHTHLADLLATFRRFPAHPQGFLGVTSYAARDDDALSQGVINFSKFWSGMGYEDIGMFYRDFGLMMARYHALRRQLGSEASAEGNLVRELGFLWWIVVAMSFTRYDSSGNGTFDQEAFAHAGTILNRITERMLALDRGSALSYVTERELGSVLGKRKCELWPRSLVHIVHRTRSPNRQPMRTWFLEICRVPRKRDRYSAQEVLRQTWQLAVRAPLIYVDDVGMVLTIEGGRER